MLSKDGFKTVSCPRCGGGGFSGNGTGYDAVCDNCGGQGEVLDFEQFEEMGMTISLLESDLLDYKTQVEQLQKEVEQYKVQLAEALEKNAEFALRMLFDEGDSHDPT